MSTTPSKPTREKPFLHGADYAAELDRQISREETMSNDPGWIPGYSEQVRVNELARIDIEQRNFTTAREIKSKDGKQLREHYYAMYGVEPRTLPVRFKWVRVADSKGEQNENVRRDLQTYLDEGWTFASKEVLATHGYGTRESWNIVDGTIRRGDVALMFVDADRAAMIDARRAREKAEREMISANADISIEHHRESNFVLPSR